MTVQVENRDNGIQIVRLTGASASKSFSRESLPIIADAIDKGLKNPEIKGMVITGEGKFFSAGADINAFQESIEANEAPQLIRDLTNILHPLLMRIRESSTIVVAAINGAAAGGGLGLALACDARVASPKDRLSWQKRANNSHQLHLNWVEKEPTLSSLMQISSIVPKPSALEFS